MKGLDKFKFNFIEAHITVECAVCNTTSDAFPCMDELVFECDKCNRHYKMSYGAVPMTQDEIEAHIKLRGTMKSNKTSFNDLP